MTSTGAASDRQAPAATPQVHFQSRRADYVKDVVERLLN